MLRFSTHRRFRATSALSCFSSVSLLPTSSHTAHTTGPQGTIELRREEVDRHRITLATTTIASTHTRTSATEVRVEQSRPGEGHRESGRTLRGRTTGLCSRVGQGWNPVLGPCSLLFDVSGFVAIRGGSLTGETTMENSHHEFPRTRTSVAH